MTALLLLLIHAFTKSFGGESFIVDVDSLCTAFLIEFMIELWIALSVVILRS